MDKNELTDLIDGLPPHDGKTFAEALADHLIASGVVIQRWIPTADRLPTRSDADCDGFVLAISKFMPATTWQWDTVVKRAEDFTHWMPVPVLHNTNSKNCGWCKHYNQVHDEGTCLCESSENYLRGVEYWDGCNCFEWSDKK